MNMLRTDDEWDQASSSHLCELGHICMLAAGWRREQFCGSRKPTDGFGTLCTRIIRYVFFVRAVAAFVQLHLPD